MDSFVEPYTREGDDISIDRVHAKIRHLEEEHKRNGIPLSGRIIHVVHSLPITATLSTSKYRPGAPPTPPLEPEAEPAAKSPAPRPQWSLAPRYGHAAMISGIMSLSATHEQCIVGWTGDILAPGASANASTTNTSAHKIPSTSLSAEEKAVLEEELKDVQVKENDGEEEPFRKATYIPVWLDDKVAHGHYDGYCKQSASHFLSLPLLRC